MAIYSELLLSEGGGIITELKRLDQAENTVNLLIGLGGTGVDCIRTIKTQVYKRLREDDEKAITPEYKHIQFLGVDSDSNSIGMKQKSNEIMPLDDTEFFSIENSNVARAFSNPIELKYSPELSWLEYERIHIPMFGDGGTCGIRQIGRFLMMNKSALFMNQVQEKIKKAKEGLSSPQVNVHIFAGLSGGTGSGCFLDVCYMVRSIAKLLDGVIIFGYFFMPDVNLSVVPIEATDVHDYIPKNGYAAMQELDYCMRLQKNGGKFKQVYQRNQIIPWEEAPVDMCYLIGATDANGNVIPNAYDYAIHTTAEYVMNFFLIQSNPSLVPLAAMVGIANGNKRIGSEMAYYTIGASCASIPLREINTYLASELFNKFGIIKQNIPSKEDVEKFATTVLTNVQGGMFSSRYESLYREIRREAEGCYKVYPNNWKFVYNYGNAEMVKHYTDQTTAQQNKVQANAKSMLIQSNEKSLMGRLKTYLEGIIRDIQYGPIFAYKMLTPSESHNFLNIIDGLIKENWERRLQEEQQSELFQKDYENAKSDFENRCKRSLFDNDEKRFDDYQFSLMRLAQHKLEMYVYNELEQVLRSFRKQVEDAIATYYFKLARVMENLMDTFNENRNIFVSNTGTSSVGTFEVPLVTIDELKDSLDAQIQQMDITQMLDAFMSMLLMEANEDKWLGADENQISRLVIDFFVDTVFNNFANRTITSFLQDKYEHRDNGIVTDNQLTRYIYEDWMKLLTERATPLFHFNPLIWSYENTSKSAFVSYPSFSTPIKKAAWQLQAINSLWKPKDSYLTDRIIAISVAAGFPMCSYIECEKYEQKFFSTRNVGRHLYEDKPIERMKFNDWRKLPSIIPQSMMDIENPNFPTELKKQIQEARELYDKACRYGLIDSEGYICKIVDDGISKLANLDSDSKVPMVRTEYYLPMDGYIWTDEDKIRIQEDYFVFSPVFQMIVKEQFDIMDSIILRV